MVVSRRVRREAEGGEFSFFIKKEKDETNASKKLSASVPLRETPKTKAKNSIT